MAFLSDWSWLLDQGSLGAQAYFLPTPAGTCPTFLSLPLLDSCRAGAGPSLSLAPGGKIIVLSLAQQLYSLVSALPQEGS
jgi:hypothetical protein